MRYRTRRLQTLTDCMDVLRDQRQRLEGQQPGLPRFEISSDSITEISRAITHERCAAWEIRDAGHQIRSMLIALPTALTPSSPKAQFFPARYAMLQFSTLDPAAVQEDMYTLYSSAIPFLLNLKLEIHRCSVYVSQTQAAEAWNNLGFSRYHCHAVHYLSKKPDLKKQQTPADTSAFTIRPAQFADRKILQQLFQDLVEIHRQPPVLHTSQEPIPQVYEDLETQLQDSSSAFFVAEYNARIVGFIEGYIGNRSDGYLAPVASEPFAYIRNCCVFPSQQGRGCGSALLSRFLGWCSSRPAPPQQIHVDYHTANLPAAGFWRKNDFHPVLYGLLRRIPLPRKRTFFRL